MRKLISFITAAAVAVTVSVIGTAAENQPVSAYLTETGITAVSFRTEGYAVLNCYDGGRLVYSTNAAGFACSFDVPQEYRDTDMRICTAGTGDVYTVQITEAPAATVTPEIDPPESETPSIGDNTPAPTATPQPAKTPYPAIYPKNMDAVNAPAVVQSVEEVMIDGENCYRTTLLYQGAEITTDIRSRVTLAKAPAWHADLVGRTADALREGDVIYFNCDLQHRIKAMMLVYRPSETDYILDGGDYGANFRNLFSPADGSAAVYGGRNSAYTTYAFGAPVKKSKGLLWLADPAGKTMPVDVADGTIVYTVNVAARGDKCELSGTGPAAMEINYFPNSAFDDEDNLISWEDADELIYALVRIVDGTATEVIVFTR